MTNLPEKEQVREAINSYSQAKGLSKKELATKVGISGATLSKIENHKWEDIDERMWRKIWNVVSDINNPGLISTRDFKTCINTCEYARKNRLMVGLIGDTGMGKTTAFSHYSINRNVFYVVYEKSMAPKHFFSALLREMGVDFIGNIHEMIAKICDELNATNSPLLIIDEASKLTNTIILYLHDLRNRTDKTTGIVLTGMPYFQRDLKKFSDKQKEGYSEFFRRITLWQTLDGLSSAEIKYICNAYSITDEEFVKDVRGKKRFADLLNEIRVYQLENQEA